MQVQSHIEEMLIEDADEEEEDLRMEEVPKVPLVYAWGRNKDGELGVGSNDEAVRQPQLPKGLRGYTKQIGTARSHTAVRSHTGRMFVSGSLLFGKTGTKATVTCFRTFKSLDAMAQHVVVKVACGDYHTLALTDTGALYSWGGRLWDKTGHKTDGIHRLERLKGQFVTDIACGDYHSVAITEKGEVYSWGGGSEDKNKGQLGHAVKKDVAQPQPIQFFKDRKVIKIACGDYFTMVMTKQEEIYGFGQGTYGQLGTGGKEDTAKPRKVLLNLTLPLQQYFQREGEVHVQQIALGSKHSLFRTNQGTLYVCGYNAQGQLGLGNTANIFEPIVVKSLLSKRLSMVAAGSNHSLALTSRHDVYSCGHNKYGQLGLAQAQLKSLTVWTHVVQLQKKRIGCIYAGAEHSWAIVDELDPIIYNYEPPSPIRVRIDDHSRNGSRPEDCKSVTNSFQSILMEMGGSRKLQLILSEVNLSHRFIHFILKDTLKAPRKRIDQYVKSVAEFEQDLLKCHKVTGDTDVYDANGLVCMTSNQKGFTVMLICELNQSANQYEAVPQRTPLAIGEIIMMPIAALRPNNKIPHHNRWFFKFLEMFQDYLEHARFIQLRPANY